MSDKYDDAVAYLTERPEEIEQAWMVGHPHHCLFQYACHEPADGAFPVDECVPYFYGCLTQIRHDRNAFRAETPELTEAISTDERIPSNEGELTPAHLPVFAEWQRRLDRELNRRL